jgi:hypothetical protein
MAIDGNYASLCVIEISDVMGLGPTGMREEDLLRDFCEDV